MNPTLLDSDKEWMNTSSVSDFASKIDFAPELYAEYLEITDFMTKGRNAQVPTMHTKYTQMKESFVELNEMYRKYMAEVSAKFQKIEELIEKSSKDVAMQDHWWESTNIFNGKTSASQLRPLQERTPPKSLDYADYIREKMYIIHQEDRPVEFDEEWFYELLDEEIARKFEIGTAESWKATVNLYILEKIDVLQSPTDTAIWERDVLMYHDRVAKYLDQMLTGWSQGDIYINAAKAARDVRERMHRHTCKALFESKCVFNTLLPLLVLLQERAHNEVQTAVFQAVGHKLPAELANLVYGFALVIEEVPSDPRIFVQSRHTKTGEICRKTRLICQHSIDWELESRELEQPMGNRVGPAQDWAWGADWIEIEPLDSSAEPLWEG